MNTNKPVQIPAPGKAGMTEALGEQMEEDEAFGRRQLQHRQLQPELRLDAPRRRELGVDEDRAVEANGRKHIGKEVHARAERLSAGRGGASVAQGGLHAHGEVVAVACFALRSGNSAHQSCMRRRWLRASVGAMPADARKRAGVSSTTR